MLFLPLEYPESPRLPRCLAPLLSRAWSTCPHTHSLSVSEKHCKASLHLQVSKRNSSHWLTAGSRRTAGPSSRNKQEKETRKAQSPGLPPPTKAQAQELGKRPASNQHVRVHTHNTQGQTNRPKSINKHNWASKEEARVALVAPHAHCSLPLGCATQPSVARMMAVPKMPTLSPRSFIWFQNSTRRVLCQ